MDITEFFPNLRRLQFPPELEALFRADYYEKSVGTTRLALWLGIALITLFGLLDVWAAPAALHLIWRIRFLLICPLDGGHRLPRARRSAHSPFRRCP